MTVSSLNCFRNILEPEDSSGIMVWAWAHFQSKPTRNHDPSPPCTVVIRSRFANRQLMGRARLLAGRSPPLGSPTSCMTAARAHGARRLQALVLAQGARRLLLVLKLAAARGTPSPSHCPREITTMRCRSSPEALLHAVLAVLAVLTG
ncbi:hypothetical protein Dimus_039067 [Dionaea muscipula]